MAKRFAQDGKTGNRNRKNLKWWRATNGRSCRKIRVLYSPAGRILPTSSRLCIRCAHLTPGNLWRASYSSRASFAPAELKNQFAARPSQSAIKRAMKVAYRVNWRKLRRPSCFSVRINVQNSRDKRNVFSFSFSGRCQWVARQRRCKKKNLLKLTSHIIQIDGNYRYRDAFVSR